MKSGAKLIGGAALSAKLLGMAAAVAADRGSLLEGGEIVLDLAQGMAPVLTGEFRDSLTMSVEGDEVVIGSTLAGAKPLAIEYGTSDTPAQPTMRPALDTGKERVVQAIGGRLARVVDGEW